MKKGLSLLMVLILVLSIGTLALAVEGTLADGQKISEKISVTATVGPYASLTIGYNGGHTSVDFGTLLGKVGIYTANDFDGTDTEFYQRAAAVFSDEAMPFYSNNKGGWGAFYIESNTEVNIAIAFDGANTWLESPTLFAIAKGGTPQEALAWASANFDLPAGEPTSFPHAYQPNPQLYGVDGAIWIQNIGQQYAKNYTGNIILTVSK